MKVLEVDRDEGWTVIGRIREVVYGLEVEVRDFLVVCIFGRGQEGLQFSGFLGSGEVLTVIDVYWKQVER